MEMWRCLGPSMCGRHLSVQDGGETEPGTAPCLLSEVRNRSTPASLRMAPALRIPHVALRWASAPEGCGHARSCGLRALWNARRGAIRRCPRVGSHGQVVPCPDSSPEASPEQVRASMPLPTIPWPSPKSADVLVPPPDTDSERPPDWAGQPNRLGVRLTDSGGDE